MLLSLSEDLKTKLTGGAAAIAIEASLIAAVMFGLTASYVTSEPKTIGIIDIPLPKTTPPEPPVASKPLEDIDVEFAAPPIDIDVPRPDDPILTAKPLDLDRPVEKPVILVTLPEAPPTVEPVKPAAIRQAAGFDRRFLAAMQPDYPTAARRLEFEGRVELRVLIGIDGRVKQAELRKTSGHPVLDEAAMAHALKKWRFKPATEDGVPVESWTVVPITFELKRA
jgi:periplasmic protein TonB